MSTLFNSIDTTISLKSVLIITISAILLGLVISVSYMLSHRRSGYLPSLVVTLTLLAPIASSIFLMVGNSVARALSVGGGIALIRYRATLEDTRDLACIFVSMAVGIACGLGFIAYAAVFTLIICLLMITLSLAKFGVPREKRLRLKIIVPENLNYYGMFDETLKKYAESYTLEKVRSSDFGTAFEVCYSIGIKDAAQQKELLDEIRSMNGNLGVSLSSMCQELV